MKTKILFLVIALVSLTIAGVLLVRSNGTPAHSHQAATLSQSDSPAVHSHVARVPAYQETSQIGSLEETLPANRFIGKSREAYQVAKQIPQTLAQLPCYCECDQSFGHKSLHSCFVSDHASQCAVCVDEALLAYKLQKQDKLTPEEVRQKIIEKYSTAQ